jgi:hypothetical protein
MHVGPFVTCIFFNNAVYNKLAGKKILPYITEPEIEHNIALLVCSAFSTFFAIVINFMSLRAPRDPENPLQTDKLYS